MGSSLNALFRPSRIAVLGASSNPEKLGFQIFRNMLEAGFAGDIIPINPKGETILGRASLKSAGEIPEGTDLAVVIIPAKMVPGTILQLGERKVKAAIVITGGFAESGHDGALLQQELTANAARCGIRIVGPNCQGVNYPYHGMCASWPLIKRRGDMAIVSQSGTVGAALMDWASEDGLGFSAFVSMGNRADVDEADLIAFFADDPNTKVIALYIEGVKNAEKFLAAVKKCHKPIVLLKPGRTERGRKAAESHTRSLAGRDEMYEAICRQHHIHRAPTLEEMYDSAKSLAYLTPPQGPRTLIVTSSGGSAVIATDVLEEEGFRVTPLPEPLRAKLREFLPAHFIVGNPLDLTGDATAEYYKKVIETAQSDYDVVMTIFGDPIPGVSQILHPGKCELVAFLGGADVEREERRLMHERKIAVFPTPERAARALACHARFRRELFPLVTPAASASPAHIATTAPGTLPSAASMVFAAKAGIAVTPFAEAANEQEAVSAAARIGYPVAVKINSPDVTHKTDVGGVILNVKDEAGVRAAFANIQQIERARGLRPGGALICAMAERGHEVIIGVTRDAQFGHAVMFGMGGTMVEVMKDVSFRVVPLTAKDAAEMISEVRGAAVLRGLRGAKPADVNAVAELLVRVSALVEKHPEIEEMDLNPVFVYEKGVVAADLRVMLRTAAATEAGA